MTKLSYKSYFATSADIDVVFTPSTLPTIFYDCNKISILPAGDMETELSNGIKIYGDKEAVDGSMHLVDDYPSIWESSGFVQNLPER